MAGVMMAGALTQWNASSAPNFFGAAGAGASIPIGMSSSVPWDWGMGWGWAGWMPEGANFNTAAYCGSCAVEQQALAQASSTSYSSHSSYNNGRHEFYYDDDHDELGELGETADVGCDFGGDFGGF